jgi:hypothetical protein
MVGKLDLVCHLRFARILLKRLETGIPSEPCFIASLPSAMARPSGLTPFLEGYSFRSAPFFSPVGAFFQDSAGVHRTANTFCEPGP